MDDYMESGPTPPQTEEDKIGEALYAILKRKYDDVDSGYLANGNPRIVHITFCNYRGGTDSDMRLLNRIRDEAEQTIANYEIDAAHTTITFAGDMVHTLEIIITPN